MELCRPLNSSATTSPLLLRQRLCSAATAWTKCVHDAQAEQPTHLPPARLPATHTPGRRMGAAHASDQPDKFVAVNYTRGCHDHPAASAHGPHRRAPPLQNTMPLLHCILTCLTLSILGRRSDELYQEMKLNPEASQLNNSALRERYAFLDIFVGMTAGQQQQGPPCFGALVTTHMHIWERWFQSCVPFRTCTINHSSSESKFCRPVH